MKTKPDVSLAQTIAAQTSTKHNERQVCTTTNGYDTHTHLRLPGTTHAPQLSPSLPATTQKHNSFPEALYNIKLDKQSELDALIKTSEPFRQTTSHLLAGTRATQKQHGLY